MKILNLFGYIYLEEPVQNDTIPLRQNISSYVGSRITNFQPQVIFYTVLCQNIFPRITVIKISSMGDASVYQLETRNKTYCIETSFFGEIICWLKHSYETILALTLTITVLFCTCFANWWTLEFEPVDGLITNNVSLHYVLFGYSYGHTNSEKKTVKIDKPWLNFE